MAAVELPPLPRALSAAPGNRLSSLDPSTLAEMYGSQLVLAGRFPDGIQYTVAPTGIVDFGVCGRCLVLATPDTLDSLGTYLDPDDAKVFEGEDEILVCAPPLDGVNAFILADLAWREARLLETTVAGLQSLMVVSSWTPERAESATGELFARLDHEARRWWACTEDVEVTHPRARWAIYTGADDDEFANNLTRGIQKFARTPASILHRPLPEVDARRLAGLVQVAALAAGHEDAGIRTHAYQAMLSHPNLILGALAENTFENKIEGLEDAATLALTRIYNEEILSVAAQEEDSKVPSRPETKLGLDSKFVFTLRAAHNYAVNAIGVEGRLHDPETAQANLDTYLGGYLGDLDLTRSFITGSAAMSSVLRSSNYGMFATHADFLESFYPTTYSVMTPGNASEVRRLSGHFTWHIGAPPPYTIEDAAAPDDAAGGAAAAPGGAASAEGAAADSKDEAPEPPRSFKGMRWHAGLPDAASLPFEEVAGADVDIAIAADGESFDRIARGHFEVIKLRFPSAVLVRVDRERSHMYRVVSAKGPGVEKGFREVEMYPASWAEICTHHVGMVRLAYTAARADETGALLEEPVPKFYMTASCLKSAVERSTPNYYFFASRKTTPQEIMIKYAARGYPPLCLPRSIQRAILRYAQKSTFWNPHGRYYYGGWSVFTNDPPARAAIGKFNLRNYHAETCAFGYQDPAPANDDDSDDDA